MAEQKKIPAVRFKGFSEEWDEKTLGEVLTERKVLQKISDDAPILAFASGQGVIDRSERKSNNRDHLTLDQANKIYKLTEFDDIVYNPSNLKYGAIDRNKHGRGVISPIYVTFITDEDPSFIEPIVKTEKFKQKALLFEEGTVVKRQSVKPENLLALDICITSNHQEQSKIGTYFQELDRMIGLHQRKHEKLVTLKKAMLQKMFPQNGATVPEIRFKGFSRAWEEKQLGGVCDLFTDGDWIESKDQSKSGIRLLQTGNVGITQFVDKQDKSKWISQATFQRLKCTEVFGGDILISRLPEPAGRACFVPSLEQKMITVVDCTIVRTSELCKNTFLVQCLSLDSYFKNINNLLAGGTRQRVSRSNLANLSIQLPTVNEQQKIGAYFRQLDELIAQHSTQLEKLKKIKVACLEKMFV